jgi:5-methylcytosine-specific restriction endonuclease McrA
VTISEDLKHLPINSQLQYPVEVEIMCRNSCRMVLRKDVERFIIRYAKAYKDGETVPFFLCKSDRPFFMKVFVRDTEIPAPFFHRVYSVCTDNLLLAPNKELRRRARALVLFSLKAMPYAEYLQSDHWKHMREIALRKAGVQCQLCTSSDRLEVHHKTYERLGEEAISDITVLCRSCHSKFHDKAA